MGAPPPAPPTWGAAAAGEAAQGPPGGAVAARRVRWGTQLAEVRTFLCSAPLPAGGARAASGEARATAQAARLFRDLGGAGRGVSGGALMTARGILPESTTARLLPGGGACVLGRCSAGSSCRPAYCASGAGRGSVGGGEPPSAAERDLRRLREGAWEEEPEALVVTAAAAWASVLIVFAGPGRHDDLAARLRARGIAVAAVDTKVGGVDHDVLRPEVGEALIARTRRGDFDAVFIATPCESYSIGHKPQLRARRSPLGIAAVPERWQRYLLKHNRLANYSARLVEAAAEAGVAWAVENPADRGDRGSDAWWAAFADHAPLWKVPVVAAAIAAAGGHARTFAQCSFGAKVQKWTTIVHAPALDSVLAALDARGCAHGRVPHEERAWGRNADGSSGQEDMQPWRGVAICDVAGGDEARAGTYVVDAESAYRFCPMQEADLWTQCFVWWDGGGAGVCVDRRLAFGGAYSPNRFEGALRASTSSAAPGDGDPPIHPSRMPSPSLPSMPHSAASAWTRDLCNGRAGP